MKPQALNNTQNAKTVLKAFVRINVNIVTSIPACYSTTANGQASVHAIHDQQLVGTHSV